MNYKNFKLQYDQRKASAHDALNNLNMSGAENKIKYWNDQYTARLNTLRMFLEANRVFIPDLLESGEIPPIEVFHLLPKPKSRDTVIPKTFPAVVQAAAVLEAGAQHMRDRAATYDKPEGERSMEKVVQMFNLFTGHNLTETEGWRFMLFLKLVRSTQGNFKLDNFEDAVAYEALAAESAAKGK